MVGSGTTSFAFFSLALRVSDMATRSQHGRHNCLTLSKKSFVLRKMKRCSNGLQSKSLFASTTHTIVFLISVSSSAQRQISLLFRLIFRKSMRRPDTAFSLFRVSLIPNTMTLKLSISVIISQFLRIKVCFISEMGLFLCDAACLRTSLMHLMNCLRWGAYTLHSYILASILDFSSNYCQI